jgi:hypothetical protein
MGESHISIRKKMKNLFPIKVECHAGYKAGEYPKYFYWDGIRFEIAEVMDRWYQGEYTPKFPQAHYFKVRTTDDKTYLLKHETENGQWYLWIKGERMDL